MPAGSAVGVTNTGGVLALRRVGGAGDCRGDAGAAAAMGDPDGEAARRAAAPVPCREPCRGPDALALRGGGPGRAGAVGGPGEGTLLALDDRGGGGGGGAGAGGGPGAALRESGASAGLHE